MIQDTTHLVALQVRLSHEREYLSNARTDNEKELRAVWIRQIEKEIEQEFIFLGMSPTMPDISDAELLAELGL
jgi:hypothetical protein